VATIFRRFNVAGGVAWRGGVASAKSSQAGPVEDRSHSRQRSARRTSTPGRRNEVEFPSSNQTDATFVLSPASALSSIELAMPVDDASLKKEEKLLA